MGIGQEHFVGFDPTQGVPPLLACPYRDEGATMVWFEKWVDTGFSRGNHVNTGIIYTQCYATFDMLGNAISSAPICGPPCCGFAGNLSCMGDIKCPTPDEWLDRARKTCAGKSLPPPGTIQFCPNFAQYIGRRLG